MQGLQKWLTGSSMSWRGLRWGAAILSVAAHSAAASFAWVMIETKPIEVIEAFNVELITLDQKQGSVRKHDAVSDSVTAQDMEKKSKADLVRAAASSSVKQNEPEQQRTKKEAVKPTEQHITAPRLEIEIAHATPVLKPIPESKQKPVRQYPEMVQPTFKVSLPPRKPKVPTVQKPTQKKIEKQKTIEQPKTRERVQPQPLLPSQVASLPSRGGVGGAVKPSKGEAIPMTAASYSIGTLGNKPPKYPERARRNEFEGRVLLRVKVSALGKSETVTIKTSSGFDILDEAAQAAVRAWRFTPAKWGDVAVAATIDVPIVFRLTNSR